jgi:outer membrane protein assembly factor BamB
MEIAGQILHGQWSSPSLGQVGIDGPNGEVELRNLVFFGAGDGRLYAFQALASVPEKPVRLKTVWSCDCIPPEYKPAKGVDAVTQYCLGDKRVRGTLNRNDGAFVGPSEIIATPVSVDNVVYVAIGRDPAHGRGRGALDCIDAAGQGDVTASRRLWTYQGLDRTLSTVSVHDGLVYCSDVAGRLHCLEARSGKCYWVHDAKCETWGSTLVADGKVYMPTSKGLWILAAGRELRVLDRINLGARVMASPIVANGTLYVATTGGWLWAVRREPR